MKTSEIIQEMKNELSTIEENLIVECAKQALIESKIKTKETVEELTREQLETLGNVFCKDAAEQQRKIDDQRTTIEGTYYHYETAEQLASIIKNPQKYIVFRDDLIPGTNRVAKRDYLRFDLTRKATMISQSSNNKIETSCIYIGVMDGNIKKNLSQFCYFVESSVFPDKNETFISATVAHIIDNNENTHMLLTEQGEPIIMLADLDRLEPSDFDSFFFKFLPYTQGRAFLRLRLQELERKK